MKSYNFFFQLQCYETTHQLKGEKTVKNTNTGRLNNTCLNNEQVTGEIKREMKKFLETNNKNMTTQNLWDVAKSVQEGSL